MAAPARLAEKQRQEAATADALEGLGRSGRSSLLSLDRNGGERVISVVLRRSAGEGHLFSSCEGSAQIRTERQNLVFFFFACLPSPNATKRGCGTPTFTLRIEPG